MQTCGWTFGVNDGLGDSGFADRKNKAAAELSPTGWKYELSLDSLDHVHERELSKWKATVNAELINTTGQQLAAR